MYRCTDTSISPCRCLYFTSLHSAPLQFTSLHFTSLHFICHITPLLSTSFYISTSFYFTLFYATSLHFISINFTPLHFVLLHFILCHFTPLHFISINFTPLRFTSFYFTSLHFILCHFTPLRFTSFYVTSLHSVPLHFTSLHFTAFLTISTTPSLHLILTLFLELLGLQATVPKASAGSWSHIWTVLFTKEYFPISVPCFLLLISLSWLVPWEAHTCELFLWAVPNFPSSIRSCDMQIWPLCFITDYCCLGRDTIWSGRKLSILQRNKQLPSSEQRIEQTRVHFVTSQKIVTSR
jgi:hypothetical protein